MEIDLAAAFYDRMAGDAQLTADLSNYPNANESSGFQPAIFTDEEVPEDATLNYAWAQDISGIPEDDKLTLGVDVLWQIAVYTQKNDSETLNRLAWRVRALFHRHALAVTNAETVIAMASLPQKAPTDDKVDGRIIEVRLRLRDSR